MPSLSNESMPVASKWRRSRPFQPSECARLVLLLCNHRHREVRQLPGERLALSVHRDGLSVGEADAEVFLRLTRYRTRCFGRDRLLITHGETQGAVVCDARLDLRRGGGLDHVAGFQIVQLGGLRWV